MGMLHNVASNVNNLQTGLKRISDQQEEFADMLSKKFEKLEHRSAVFEQKLDEVRKPQPSSNKPLPGPAKTVEELNVHVKQLELPVALQGLVRVSVSESVRRILKRLFTREPTMQFSFPGLGHRRQQSKIAFKDHCAMRIIHEVLAAGGFTNHKEIAVATQRGLPGSVDWDGNRHRSTGDTEAVGIATTTSISTTTTTVSTDTVHPPSITYLAERVPSSDLIESDSEISA